MASYRGYAWARASESARRCAQRQALVRRACVGGPYALLLPLKTQAAASTAAGASTFAFCAFAFDLGVGLTCSALVAHELPIHAKSALCGVASLANPCGHSGGAAVAHGAENRTRRRAAAVPLSRKRCSSLFSPRCWSCSKNSTRRIIALAALMRRSSCLSCSIAIERRLQRVFCRNIWCVISFCGRIFRFQNRNHERILNYRICMHYHQRQRCRRLLAAACPVLGGYLQRCHCWRCFQKGFGHHCKLRGVKYDPGGSAMLSYWLATECVWWTRCGRVEQGTLIFE